MFFSEWKWHLSSAGSDFKQFQEWIYCLLKLLQSLQRLVKFFPGKFHAGYEQSLHGRYWQSKYLIRIYFHTRYRCYHSKPYTNFHSISSVISAVRQLIFYHKVFLGFNRWTEPVVNGWWNMPALVQITTCPLCGSWSSQFGLLLQLFTFRCT